MDTTIIESTTWLDILPTEIIFIIFNYLSSNDIIYTFSCFNQRFNNLLLQNRHYFNYFELPTTNLNKWKNILSIIGSKIEYLNIKINSLSFPLRYFSNLKSLIICSPYGLPEEELKSIIESKQFQNLHLLKVKTDRPDRSFNYYYSDKDYLFEDIFNNGKSLETLTIPLHYLSSIHSLKVNFNLHSMTLNTIYFEDILLLIEHTPNLEYLNVNSYVSPTNEHQISTNKINIKLKQLYLTLHDPRSDFMLYAPNERSYWYQQLTNCIEKFSSSLICLSLNLVDVPSRDLNEIPFNSIKLQQVLQSTKELKEFHLYAKLDSGSIISDLILSEFENEYWFDHNWSFGMYGSYFYTLPFHFDYLYDFSNGFMNVRSNNPSILIDNPRLWYNVKSIELERIYDYDRNFLKELKIKMPKLNLIKFGNEEVLSESDSSVMINEIDKIDLKLNNVTTIKFICGLVDGESYRIISSLPNLKHLILSSAYFPSIDSKLCRILNEKIQRLDINMYSDLDLGQLTNRCYVYFSNVEYINFYLIYFRRELKWYADGIMKMLTNFKNLKSLLIYFPRENNSYISCTREAKWSKLIEYLNMDTIMKNYKVKYFLGYSLFLKREFNDNEVEEISPIDVNNGITLTNQNITSK